MDLDLAEDALNLLNESTLTQLHNGSRYISVVSRFVNFTLIKIPSGWGSGDGLPIIFIPWNYDYF